MWYVVHRKNLSFSGAARDGAAPFVYASAAAACAVDEKRRCARHSKISASAYEILPVLPGVFMNAGPSPRTRQFSKVAGLTPINAAASRLGIKISINITPTNLCRTGEASMVSTRGTGLSRNRH